MPRRVDADQVSMRRIGSKRERNGDPVQRQRGEPSSLRARNVFGGTFDAVRNRRPFSLGAVRRRQLLRIRRGADTLARRAARCGNGGGAWRRLRGRLRRRYRSAGHHGACDGLRSGRRRGRTRGGAVPAGAARFALAPAAGGVDHAAAAGGGRAARGRRDRRVRVFGDVSQDGRLFRLSRVSAEDAGDGVAGVRAVQRAAAGDERRRALLPAGAGVRGIRSVFFSMRSIRRLHSR